MNTLCGALHVVNIRIVTALRVLHFVSLFSSLLKAALQLRSVLPSARYFQNLLDFNLFFRRVQPSDQGLLQLDLKAAVKQYSSSLWAG